MAADKTTLFMRTSFEKGCPPRRGTLDVNACKRRASERAQPSNPERDANLRCSAAVPAAAARAARRGGVKCSAVTSVWMTVPRRTVTPSGISAFLPIVVMPWPSAGFSPRRGLADARLAADADGLVHDRALDAGPGVDPGVGQDRPTRGSPRSGRRRRPAKGCCFSTRAPGRDDAAVGDHAVLDDGAVHGSRPAAAPRSACGRSRRGRSGRPAAAS